LNLPDKITVIVPTHERHHYLTRALDYWGKTDLPILVADSSLDKFSDQIPNNVKYYHYPQKSRLSTSLTKKLVDVLKKVSTEYSVVCGDTDFLTYKGIEESVAFLDQNRDYVVAHGKYIAVVHPGNNFEPDGRFCWSQLYESESNKFPNPKDRILYHFENYFCPTFYGVHRKDDLILVLEEADEYTDDYRFVEMLPTMLTVILGKVKRLNGLYGARELALKKKNLPDLLTYKKEGFFNERYERFKSRLIKYLSKETQINITETGKVIDAGMDKYITSISTSIASRNKNRTFFTDWPYSKDRDKFNLIKSCMLKYDKIIPENKKK
jgi:glycosyltransferase domain-containing protein